MLRTAVLFALVLGFTLASTRFLSAAEDATPIDAQEIVARTFENLYGFNSVQQVEITSGAAGRETFTRSAQVIRAGTAAGLNKMLVRFTGPPDLRGIGLLLLEQENFQYDAFLYQPILKKVRRVSVYQRHDQFFGTDLAFEDLEGKRADQWSARWLRSEELLGRKTWVIELRPREFPSGYDRIVGWFDRARPVVVRFEFYRAGERLKTIDFDPGAVVDRQGFAIPTSLALLGAGGSRTGVEVSEIEIRDSFPRNRFSASSLERGDVKRDAAVDK